MKFLLIGLLSLVALNLFAVETIDPDKPLFQKRHNLPLWPPFALKEVGHPKPPKLSPAERAQIEATANAAMYRKAAYVSWVLAGLACIISYLMKAREGIGVAIICGLFSIISSFMAETAHYFLRIGVPILIIIMVGICYHPKIRNWSITHIFTRKGKK